MSKFIMMVGLPGSGKSTVADKYYPNAVWVSSDAIREELWGDASDQRNPEVVFEEMERRTLEALNDYHDVVYDATNLHSRTRKKLVTSIKRQVPGVESASANWLLPPLANARDASSIAPARFLMK